MRGRLIFPFLAEIYRLDPASMSADPDGAGPQQSGYDPDFKEAVLIDSDDDGIAEPLRREYPIRVPCQVEPEVFESLRMFPSGNTPRLSLGLVFHFGDLGRLNLVDVTGDARIRPGDRLGAIYDVRGSLVQAVPTPPGLYATEVRALGWGLNRQHPRRNLLMVTFRDRPAARGA